jgi:TPR repeat protein
MTLAVACVASATATALLAPSLAVAGDDVQAPKAGHPKKKHVTPADQPAPMPDNPEHKPNQPPPQKTVVETRVIVERPAVEVSDSVIVGQPSPPRPTVDTQAALAFDTPAATTPSPTASTTTSSSDEADALAKGEAAYQSKDWPNALYWLTVAGSQRSAEGQYMLGELYYNFHRGAGLRDRVIGVMWYQRAADQGDAKAQRAQPDWLAASELGELYLDGRGVTRDYAKAMSLFMQAAQVGDPMAERAISQMYAKGEAVPKDAAQAQSWADRAANDSTGDAATVANYRARLLGPIGQ